MKIVAGLGTIDDYEAYIEAGADELFIGYVPYAWQRSFGTGTPLNRREVHYVNVNIGSRSELEILAEKIKQKNVPVSIAFNSLNYEEEQYPVIMDIITDCSELGFKDIIVADIGLLIHLYKCGLSKTLNIHVSGELGEMNSSQIKLLERLEISRIIYHRGTTLDDMQYMIAHTKSLEHEAFFMNERCHFTGAYCNSIHCDELVPMCRVPYKVEGYNPIEQDAEESMDSIDGCGLCALKRLYNMGVTHIKIVGRGASTEYMIDCIKKAKDAINILSTSKSEEEYVSLVQSNIITNPCNHRCYYFIPR